MGRMLFRRHPFRLSAIVAVLLAGSLVAACDSDGTAESGGTAVASPIGQEAADRALRGLCEARDLAGREDLEAARNVFFDEAHQFLHELAVPLQERAAAAARDLLVAKNRVETALAGRPDPEGVGPEQRIEELRLAAAAGVEKMGLSAAQCA